MKNFCLIYLLLFSLLGFSQNDSFEKQCRIIEDIISTKPDSAFSIIKKLQHNNTYSLTNQKTLLTSYEALITCQYKANFTLAKKLNEDSYTKNKKANNTFGLAYNQYNYAQIFHRKSDYVNAVKNYHLATEYATNTKNYVLQHKIYVGLSGVYLDQKNYQKSLDYAQKSIDLYSTSKDKFQKATAIGFKAETYRLMGKIKEAEDLFSKAFELHKSINKKEGMAWVLGNWSLIYDLDLIKSAEMELEAEKLWDKIAPEGYLAVNNLGNIGWCFDYIAHNDSLVKIYSPKIGIKTKEEYLNQAEKYYQKAINISKKTKTPNIYLYFSKSLADLQSRRNNYKEAYQNLLTYSKLNDSLYSQENKNKISEFENAKKIALKDKEIEINQLTIKKNQQQKIFFILLALLLGSIGILLYFQNKNKIATNKRLQKLNEDLAHSNYVKNRFFNILNHDLRGPLAHIVQFFHFKNENIFEGENLKDMEQRITLKTENLLHSMEDLLLWGKSQMQTFEIQKENIWVSSIFEYLEKHFSYLDNYQIEFNNPKNLKLFSDEDILKTICRNLTANAVNALEEKENKKIIWEAYSDANSSFLKITDFCGATEDTFKNLNSNTEHIGIKHGLGLHLIKELSKSLDINIQTYPTFDKTEIVLTFKD